MNTEITIIASIFLLLGGTGSVSVYARLQQYFMDAPLDNRQIDVY